MSKTKISMRIDSDLLKDARILAAREGTSVSRLLATQLEDLIRQHNAYESAKCRALARMRKGFPLGSVHRTRDELRNRSER